ncbi:MAG: hypothetical protein KY439_05900 [Actinobacteria bacterium]|nr:hypothetical protein [Actinomycetota bacterium]
MSADQRERLRRAHQRLRNTSAALEALVATEPLRGRWAPQPAPPEALHGAADDLYRAYEGLLRCHRELLGWEPPSR